MKLEFTPSNKGSFWNFYGIRLRIIGWDQNRKDVIIVENEYGDMWELQNDLRNWRRLEGCDSFKWIEETFPQYRAVYDKAFHSELAFHRRDSANKTVLVYKDGTESVWTCEWVKDNETLNPQITKEKAFAMLDPQQIEEVFPQHWTTIDPPTSSVAYVVKHDARSYSGVYKNGTTFGGRFNWRDYDSEQRKQLTEAEAKALLDKPVEDVLVYNPPTDPKFEYCRRDNADDMVFTGINITEPVEASEDWVELTDPEHVLREGIDWCRWHKSTWVQVLDMRDRKLDEHNFDKWKFRCLRKDLPVVPKTTRTVVIKEWIIWDTPGYEKRVWSANDPRGWNHVHETGNTREIEVPL